MEADFADFLGPFPSIHSAFPIRLGPYRHPISSHLLCLAKIPSARREARHLEAKGRRTKSRPAVKNTPSESRVDAHPGALSEQSPALVRVMPGLISLSEAWQATVSPSAPVQGPVGFARSRGHAVLYTVLFLLVMSMFGCAIMNRYVFLLKKEIAATPERISLPYQEVWFQARDRVQLNGWLVPGAPGAPLVLFFHGNAGNLSDNLEYLNLLHGRGFPIFIFDYRGYGKSDGEPLRETDLYQDARGALDYLEGKGWRHESMIFYGQSLGSAVALQMALETPPAGLVMESSFTSMKDIVKYVSPLAYYTVGWWGIDLPFDNLAKIDRVEVPLLLIHGDKDPVVPLQMTMELFDHAGAPKMLYIISGGGHCDVFTLDSSAYLAAWGSYLQSIAVRTANRSGVKP
jgi:uncharacterized protein